MDSVKVDAMTELSQAQYALNFARAYEPNNIPACKRQLRAAQRVMRKVQPPLRLPHIRELASLLSGLKRDIDDDYRAHEDDDKPGMSVTIGWSEDGAWSYQTGDNSFTGGAYGYPHWATVNLYRRANCQELARDIRRQLTECVD